MLNLDIVCFLFSGNCEARPPVYSCRFPHHPLWGVKHCTGPICHEAQPQVLISEQSVVPVTVETGTSVTFNWYHEWNVIHLNSAMVRVPCSLKIKFLIFPTVVTVQVVFPLPSWYVSSRREYIKQSCDSLVWVFLQGKISSMWKGFNSLCLLWYVEC